MAYDKSKRVVIFQTGIHEIARKALRLQDRFRLMMKRRKLARAETNLGLLGWQRADFNSPELKEQVRRIHAAEKAQLDLMNERAGLSDKICALKAELESSGKSSSVQIAAIGGEVESLKSKLAELTSQITEKNNNIARFNIGLLDLQEQVSDLFVVHSKLSLGPRTGIVSAELMRSEALRLEMHGEVRELQLNRSRQEFELCKLNAALEPLQADLSRTAGRLKAMQEESSENECQLTSRIRDGECAVEKIGKRIESINRDKEEPHRLIGRSLADENIPPINQPEALENVHELRLMAEQLEAKIARSLAFTAQANRRELLIFYALVCLALVALAIAVRF